MVTISTQHLQDIFTSLGLEFHDNNNDGRVSVSTKQADSKSSRTDTISYNVQTAPNEWRQEEYTLTGNDLSNYAQFTTTIQRLSGNKQIFFLGDESNSPENADTKSYAVFKRPRGVYERKYFPSDFVDQVNLKTGSSLVDLVDPSESYAYRSMRYIGAFPRLSFLEEGSVQAYQSEILKFIQQDEDAICAGQTTNAFEKECREEVSNLSENLLASLPEFVSGYSKLKKQYADFTTRFEQGALQFSDVAALEKAFTEFEPIDQAYQAELKKTASILRSRKIDAESFRSAQVKTPQ